MNDNDKPKDDDWGMTMPHMRLKQEKNEDDFSDDYAPQQNAPVNQSPENDWSMTTPNINLGQNPQHSDFDKTISNAAPREDWQMNAPKPETSDNQPPDDWSMTTPNINLSQNSPADFDKTTPHVNIPQEVRNEQKSSTENAPHQPADDWSMTTPNVNIPKPEIQNNWQMPQPVVRISSGTKTVPESPPRNRAASPNDGEEQDNFNQTTPYYNLSENRREAVPESAPIAEPQTEISAPTPKKGSKLPFIIGGVFALFFFGIAALGGVYFLFLRNTNTATANINKENNEETTSKTNPVSSSPISSNANSSNSTTSVNLPKEIDFKGKMMLVAAGSFTMGSDSGEDISKPAHEVTLPAFYIDKTEVTNAQYKEFCDATNKSYPPDLLEKDYFLKRPNAPVVGVSFEDAKAYAAWANKRLPTEEEWEKAASWDETTKSKREFSWGNDFQKANAAFGGETTSDVGKFTSGASFYGVMDMSGNVLEWVDAYFQPYKDNTTTNPNFGETYRVVRGGFFKATDKDWLKTTKRIYIPPDMASSETDQEQRIPPIGFRCAVSADNSSLKDVLSK